MRLALLSFLLLRTVTAFSQGDALIPGVFMTDQSPLDNRFAITSADGNRIAMRSFKGYAMLDIPARTYSFLPAEDGARLSPDFSFLFNNKLHINDLARIVYPDAGSKEARWSSWVSDATGGGKKEWRNEHYILAMNGENNLITSKPWMIQEEGYNYIGGLYGIFLVDRKTGTTLKTLRSDTIYRRKPGQMNFLAPHVQYIPSLNTLLMQPEWPDYKTLLYPLDGGEPVQARMQLKPNPYVATDDRFYYSWMNDRYGGVNTYFTIKDMLTGEEISKKYESPLTYQPDGYGPVLFGFWNGHLFRYDRESKTAYEESVAGKDLKVQQQWKVDLGGEVISHDQQWRMAVGNGPTLFIFPLKYDVAKANSSSNRAFLVDLPTGKIVAKVFPFFNPDADMLAHEARVKTANEEYAAKQKKDAADKLAATIKANWTDKGYQRGRTYRFGSSYIIMDSYDAQKDVYKFWQPQQRYEATGSTMSAMFIEVPGYGFRGGDYSTRKQFVTCSECEGDGHFEYTEYTTKTKDLPWGYFSGIETKKITTTSTTKFRTCTKCHGQGVVLQ